MEVTVKKLRKCKQPPVCSSSLIVGEASVVKCWRQTPPNFAFAVCCTLSDYFPSSINKGLFLAGSKSDRQGHLLIIRKLNIIKTNLASFSFSYRPFQWSTYNDWSAECVCAVRVCACHKNSTKMTFDLHLWHDGWPWPFLGHGWSRWISRWHDETTSLQFCKAKTSRRPSLKCRPESETVKK